MIALLLTSACAGAAPPRATTPRASVAPTAPTQRRADPEPEVALTGGLGGISPYSVQEALEPHMDALARCVEARREASVPLGGRARLAFRIHLDGTVRWVHVRESNLGDRDAERCLTDVAGAVRFRRPGGGEAEFSWTLDLGDPGEDVAWDVARRPAVTRVARRAHEACGAPDGVRVTAWVGPGGRVIRAGASVELPEQASALDCVTDTVQRARMPSPGRRLARVTFALPRSE